MATLTWLSLTLFYGSIVAFPRSGSSVVGLGSHRLCNPVYGGMPLARSLVWNISMIGILMNVAGLFLK